MVSEILKVSRLKYDCTVQAVLQNFTKVQMALNLWSWVPDTHVGCPEVECREILDTRMLDVKIWHATWVSFEGSPTCVNFMIRRSFPRSKYVATESKIPKKHPSITMRKPPRSARIQKQWHEPTKILADVRFDRVLSYFCDCRKAQVYAPEPYSRNPTDSERYLRFSRYRSENTWIS